MLCGAEHAATLARLAMCPEVAFQHQCTSLLHRQLLEHPCLTHHHAQQPPQWLVLQLVDALEWCSELGISHVSAFAFGVENFKRSQAEVETLMALAEEKLRFLAQVLARLQSSCCKALPATFMLATSWDTTHAPVLLWLDGLECSCSDPQYAGRSLA